MGVDLNAIAGSGYKGRIHAEDVAEFSYVLSVDTPLVARACDRIQVDSHAVSQ